IRSVGRSRQIGRAGARLRVTSRSEDRTMAKADKAGGKKKAAARVAKLERDVADARAKEEKRRRKLERAVQAVGAAELLLWAARESPLEAPPARKASKAD